ncbi:MAG: hypothetical protein ABIJ00_02515 [Candidatus Eisenbacteria bacterium]
MITGGIIWDWSPDGTAILCNKADEQIWLVSVAGGEHKQITNEPWACGDADFSPCGTKIAYVVNELQNWGIWILDLNSLDAQRVYSAYGPDWSPDSSEILCDSLVIIREDGTRMRKVPYDAALGYPRRGRWSSDGQKIAFSAWSVDGDGGIWLIDIDGSDLVLIAQSASRPSWSPDGAMMAFNAISADGKTTAIWVMNSDGSSKTQVTFP